MGLKSKPNSNPKCVFSYRFFTVHWQVCLVFISVYLFVYLTTGGVGPVTPHTVHSWFLYDIVQARLVDSKSPHFTNILNMSTSLDFSCSWTWTNLLAFELFTLNMCDCYEPFIGPTCGGCEMLCNTPIAVNLIGNSHFSIPL